MKTLLRQLIAAAPTVENGELRAAEILKAYFECHGLTAELDIWDGNRANLLVHLKADTPTGAPLLAAAHLDVVPAAAGWTTAPFAMAERDGRLYGRGTTDMLGAVAAIAAALVETAKEKPPLPRDIVFASAAGEETDSCGAKRLVSQLKERFGAVSGVLIPEPTDLKVLRAHRGILWLKIAAHGRTAHGSMPHLGINAILKINTLLNRLGDFTLPQPPHPLLGGCSMSVNRIAGGSGTNIVPEHVRWRLTSAPCRAKQPRRSPHNSTNCWPSSPQPTRNFRRIDPSCAASPQWRRRPTSRLCGRSVRRSAHHRPALSALRPMAHILPRWAP